MNDNNDRREHAVGGELTRDQLAREAMHLAPEHLFALLRFDGYPVDGLRLGRARRMDTQASTTRWLVDGLYLRRVGPRVELWLVEMQSRSRRRSPARAGGLLLAAVAQLINERLKPEDDLHVHLVEVRTQQAARTHRPPGHVHDDPDDEGLAEACLATPAVAFSVSNRLLLDGDWTLCLHAEPAAWPLWALGRYVGANAIVGRIAALGRGVRYGGWIAALLRWIGRVRFPHDGRFWDAPKERGEAMSEALAQMVEDERVTEAESDELVRRYLARLEAQCEELREEGREEGLELGQRKALISLAESVSPDSAGALQSIDDLDELRGAVLAIVSGANRG